MEIFSEQWAFETLLLTEVRISGYVRDCDASPEKRIPGIWVSAHNDDWSFEDLFQHAGGFVLGIPPRAIEEKEEAQSQPASNVRDSTCPPGELHASFAVIRNQLVPSYASSNNTMPVGFAAGL